MQEFSTEEEWNNILKESQEYPVIVVKHSNSCPISARGYSQVEQFANEHDTVPVYVTVVQDAPELKQKIAADTNVVHESPQVLILKDGKATFHVSHYDITKEELINQFTSANSTNQ